jgi:kumamolisin
LLVLLVVAAMMVPAGILAPAVAHGPGPAAEISTDALSAAGFAGRAGFSPALVHEVEEPLPTSSSQQLVVTFVASNATFYDAPGEGAAPMTVTQIADEYGLSSSAYASAEQYFESNGLVVSHAWPDRLSLSLTGTPTAVDRAFGTTLLSGIYAGRPVTFPAAAPSLPVELESEIQSVAGLTSGFDQFTLPVIPEISPMLASPAQNPDDLVTPSIARDIYDISGLYNLTPEPTYASGKAIVLLLWGLGYAPNDIQTFFAQDYPSSFPAPNVVPYPIDGAPHPSANAVNDPSNGSRELTLDIEWAGSMAPGATLDAVYAPAGSAMNSYSPTDASMIDALNTAVDPSDLPNVAAISMSFGSADGADSTLTNGFETDFAVAAHEKISLFAATGDTGGDATSGCTGGPQAQYPSASTQVVAVGGSSVSLQRGVLGAITGFSESAWSGSGGGFSAQFAAPAWQEVGSAKAPIEANGHRGLPDVAATADYNYLYFNGGEAAGGGTSFATPLWAGMVTEMDALRGHNFGFLTPALYALAANTSAKDYPLNDITTGGNCLGTAGPGWDTATGWGSPIGVYLYEHLVSSFVNLTISATPSPVAPGGPVLVLVSISNSTSGRPIAGVSVIVSLSSDGIGGPCSGLFGLAGPESNGSGAALATISIPYCYLGSSAVATALVSSGGYYGNISTTVTVNLLGFDPALSPLSQYPNNVALYVVLMSLSIVAGWLIGRGPDAVESPPPGPPSSAPSAPTVVAPAAVPGPQPPPATAPPQPPPAPSATPAAGDSPPFTP